MIKQAGLRSDDIQEMLRRLRMSWRGDPARLNRLLQRYYLSCCRRIWKLLPLEESRRCVEVAERHLEGNSTDEELSEWVYIAEGAAVLFYFPQNDPDPERITRSIAEVEGFSPSELRELIHPPYPATWESTSDLLSHAAYLVVLSACSPGIRPIDNIDVSYSHFLSAALLREIFGAFVDL